MESHRLHGHPSYRSLTQLVSIAEARKAISSSTSDTVTARRDIVSSMKDMLHFIKNYLNRQFGETPKGPTFVTLEDAKDLNQDIVRLTSKVYNMLIVDASDASRRSAAPEIHLDDVHKALSNFRTKIAKSMDRQSDIEMLKKSVNKVASMLGKRRELDNTGNKGAENTKETMKGE